MLFSGGAILKGWGLSAIWLQPAWISRGVWSSAGDLSEVPRLPGSPVFLSETECRTVVHHTPRESERRRDCEAGWGFGGGVCPATSTVERPCAPQLPLLEGSGL